MKKILLTFFILLSFNSFSQEEIITQFKFDTKFYNGTNHWVVFPNNGKSNKFIYGYIYMDKEAGLTLNLEGKLEYKNNQLLPEEKDSTKTNFVKYRLERDTNNVHILDEDQLSQLNLKTAPDWIKFYKIDSSDVHSLKKIGYHFNHVGGSSRAIKPLLKAYKIEPHYDGLEFELAYAYNDTKQFDKAISVLKKAIENNPKNYYFYRELGYAERYLGNIDEAEKVYLKGIEMSDNDFEKSEMAVNMAQAYYMIKNRTKFDEWRNKTKKFTKENSRYYQMVELMDKKWDEKR